MAKRLTRITTRTGDDGTTGLGDGKRVAKDDLVVETIGTVDELNSWLGYLVSRLAEAQTPRTILTRCQHTLFDLGGELSVPGTTTIDAEDVRHLEGSIAQLNEELPPLEDFVLPGGNRDAAICHVARTVCRRAERCIVSLHREAQVNEQSLMYLNRLSDLLFVMARVLARRDGGKEVLWSTKEQRDSGS